MCSPQVILAAIGAQDQHVCRCHQAGADAPEAGARTDGHPGHPGHAGSTVDRRPRPAGPQARAAEADASAAPGRAATSRRTALRAAVAGALGLAGTAVLAASPAAAAAAPADPPAPSDYPESVPDMLRRGGRRIVDLTHPLSADFPVFQFYVRKPEQRQVMFEDVMGFNSAEWTFNEHAGTHMDVPAHSEAGLATADEIRLEDLVAPLVVVRIADRAERENTTELTVDDLRGWEREHGRIPEGAFVAMDSGWYQRVDDAEAFLQFDRAAEVMRFPGVSVEAAEFLIAERDIVGFGTDTTSLDVGTRVEPLTHRTLLTTGRYGLENLAALDQVPERGATLIVGVPKLRGGFGAPVRAMAFL
ncbi:cyclase family protein [Streptomonospora nanhaiensis]|uniref:cyclase family protein n=1 Tax=Streptomonospora nanhaiensis TaxID=1323731 RepID=UPI001C382158|nr:cyclase family protein [Streptomonospora nanhaiensis]MBV2362917.1 cyclase family protein [Streptomonospora nanhaiensis]